MAWPEFGPDGDILFCHVDSGGAAIWGAMTGFAYRVQRGGTGLNTRALSLLLWGVFSTARGRPAYNGWKRLREARVSHPPEQP